MIKKLAQTILPIVFAVLLALALDAWYDNWKQKKLIKNALTEIVLDIQVYAATGPVLDFNADWLDSLTSSIQRFENGEEIQFPFGFGRPETSSLAWQMAKENGIASGFGRDIYKDISRVYIEYDRLQNLWDYNYQFKLSRDPDMAPYTVARHFVRQMRRIQSRHEQLIEKSKEFIEKHGDEFLEEQPN